MGVLNQPRYRGSSQEIAAEGAQNKEKVGVKSQTKIGTRGQKKEVTLTKCRMSGSTMVIRMISSFNGISETTQRTEISAHCIGRRPKITYTPYRHGIRPL